MPERIPPCDLKEVQPNPEELKAALAIIKASGGAAENKKRSLNGSFRHFLKQHTEIHDNSDALNSRGQAREDFLVKFFVHQARAKNAQKETRHNKTWSTNSEKFVETHEWGSEKMDSEMGAMRAATLRKSGKIPSKPCPFTGSTEEHMKVWTIPMKWDRFTEADWTSFTASVQADASADELAEANNALKTMGSNCVPAPGNVVVKNEETGEADPTKEVTERVESFKLNKKQVLSKLQTDQLNCDIMMATLKAKQTEGDSSVKYSENFANDLDAHNKKLVKTAKMIHRYCANDPAVNEAGLPSLIDVCASLANKQKDINYWAQRFGLIEQKEPKRKAPKTSS